MTLIEFIYDRNYPVRISADGGSTHFAPGLVEEIFEAYAQYKAENLPISDVTQWVAVEDHKPKDCESIIGIQMPHEARYACHREHNLYISDETGESVFITHWMYAPEPPCAHNGK
jgi:hypothetical protein